MQKAVFIDLQGTLGGEGTGDIRDFKLYPFSAQAIREINDHGMLAIIVTDQSHIHKEGLGMACFNDGIDQLKRELLAVGARLDEVYCCPHTRQEHCPCKKPQTYFIDKAVEKYDLDIAHSFVVGDMGMNDMVMAKNAGAKGVLVLTGVGRGSLNEYRYTWQQYEADYVAENVLDAVHWILSVNDTLP